jgi:hypothetical protein
MERKVIGPALFLICLIASCQEKKPKLLTYIDSLKIDSVTSPSSSVAQQQNDVVEIVEYRSESLKDYSLYAIYPTDDEPLYFVSEKDSARLL